MAYSFSKLWTDPSDFPTVETDETKVREDMQCLFDELLDMVNDLQSGSGFAFQSLSGALITPNSLTGDKLVKWSIDRDRIIKGAVDESVIDGSVQKHIFHATVSVPRWIATAVVGVGTIYTATGTLTGSGSHAGWVSGHKITNPNPIALAVPKVSPDENLASARGCTFSASADVTTQGTYGTGSYSYTINWMIKTAGPAGSSSAPGAIDFDLFLIPIP